MKIYVNPARKMERDFSVLPNRIRNLSRVNSETLIKAQRMANGSARSTQDR